MLSLKHGWELLFGIASAFESGVKNNRHLSPWLYFVLCLINDVIYPGYSELAPKLTLNEFLLFLKTPARTYKSFTQLLHKLGNQDSALIFTL